MESQPPIKLKYKTQYVLTYLGFLNCDMIETVANNDKPKLTKITKDDLCKIVHKFCEGINKFATYYDKGIIMQFKNDMSDLHHDEQKELLTKLVTSLKSPSRRESQGSPIKSPPRNLEKHPRGILKSPAKVAKDLSQTFDQGTSGTQQTAPAVANSEDGPAREAEKAALAKDSGSASEVIPPEKLVPPEKVSQIPAKPQPPKEKGICRFYRQNRCRHSNTEGDMCEYKHPGVCKIYQLAGDTDKGCQNSTCQELHPALCGKWKKGGWTGPCGNQDCRKLHPSVPKVIPMVNKERPKKTGSAPPGEGPVAAPWSMERRQHAWKEGMQPYSSQDNQAYFEKRFQDMQKTMMDQMKSMMQTFMLPQSTYQPQFSQPPPQLPQYHQQSHHQSHQQSTFQQPQPTVPQPGTIQHPSFQQGQTNHRPTDLQPQQNHQLQYPPLYK